MSKTPQPLYQALAGLVGARINCQKSGNKEWEERHGEGIDRLVDFLPSGSGIDSGSEIDLDKSTSNKLVFVLGYHHMDEHGVYCGWTHHTVTVHSHLHSGFELTISGPNRSEIKDYLHEVFHSALLDKVRQRETDPGVWAWECERYAAYSW